MKEIKRFYVVLTDNSVDELVESKSGYWCRYEDFEQLQARIKELESDKHINEIKAQGIEEFINFGYELANSGNYPFTLSDNFIFNEYKKKLRNNNE